jgi:Transposase DDE domain group 1
VDAVCGRSARRRGPLPGAWLEIAAAAGGRARGVRERPEAKGRRLIDVPGYTFHALVTTLELSPVDAWHFYNGRADSENCFKELKEDFGADGFCLQSFDGTEAAFRLICFLFNLIADFKREVTRDESPRLMTLRSQILVVGAILGTDGRKAVLRLGLR